MRRASAISSEWRSVSPRGCQSSSVSVVARDGLHECGLPIAAAKRSTHGVRPRRSFQFRDACPSNVASRVGMLSSRSVLCSFLLCGVAALDAAQPAGVAAALAGLRSKIQSIDGATVADPTAYERVAGEAASSAVADVAASARSRAIAAAANEAARSSVASWRYIGGCPRDFSGCPTDFAAGSDGACSPPGDASCGVTVLASMSAAQKEAVAVACQASWPCKACIVSFDGCPEGWVSEGQSCAAPSGYAGACGPSVDFTTMSRNGKARWAAICDARWPCA